MNMNLTTAEVYGIVSFYIEDTKKPDGIVSRLSNLLKWKLKRNIAVLQPVAEEFEKFREETRNQLFAEWFTDEKSDPYEEPILDENGEQKLDEEGNVLTNSLRKIKPEFMDDYSKAADEANKKIIEVANNVESYKLNTANVEAEIEKIINDLSDEDFSRVDVLMFMNEEGDE